MKRPAYRFNCGDWFLYEDFKCVVYDKDSQHILCLDCENGEVFKIPLHESLTPIKVDIRLDHSGI